VLGVDGDHVRAGGLGERHHQLAAHDERLLVGEREVDALAQGGDGRPEAGAADDGVEHEVALGVGDDLDEPVGAAEDRAVGPVFGCAGGRAVVREGDRLDPELRGLLDHALETGGGRETHDLEVVGPLDHVECLLADRAGRAENDHAPHGLRVYAGV
jgi:hypothetical protein